MTRFVNPYTFVPHVPAPQRGEPSGHARLRDGALSGVLHVTVTARTPLLIGGFRGQDQDGELQILPRRASGGRQVMIPGSGFLGAVRSVHETLTGSCLRVLNSDWAPAHRHPAAPRETDGLRLAVVTGFEPRGAGQPPRVTVKVSEEWRMIPLRALPADPLPATGDQFRLPSDADTGNLDALPARSATRLGGMGTPPVSAGDGWVLLVTDTTTRHREPVRFPAGRVAASAPDLVVPDDVMTRYQDVVAGANDLRTNVVGSEDEPPYDPENPGFLPVKWRPENGRVVAKRLPARTYLHVGQPVFVRLGRAARGEGTEVTEIRLSMLWRYQGLREPLPGDRERGSGTDRGTVGDRAGGAVPCRDPEHLCWSCRVFGSADTSGRDPDDLAVQRGYRGHVRVDDLLASSEVPAPTVWHLAPLLSPKPSAGQFYLDHSETPARSLLAEKRNRKEERPAATWGSVADKQRSRPIRGRKYYWRSREVTGNEPHPRGQFREHQRDQVTRRAQLIPADTVFTGRIRFDNLSLADYGSLLAALSPRLLAGPDHESGAGDDRAWAQTVTSVGGGKPFGFGAVDVTVKPEIVESAAARYLGEDDDVPATEGDAIEAFLEQVDGTPAHGQWERLRHVLTPGYIADDDLIWYPPGPGEDKDDPAFDRSFEFFGKTNGVQLKEETRAMVFLPDPKGPPEDQILEFEWGTGEGDSA